MLGFEYTLLKVVSPYSFSIMSISVIGFQESVDMGVEGSAISSFILDFWGKN